MSYFMPLLAGSYHARRNARRAGVGMMDMLGRGTWCNAGQQGGTREDQAAAAGSW